MPSEKVFTIAIAVPLLKSNINKGKKFMTAGAIVRDERGYMYGKLELRPVDEWDGGFYLFPYDRKAKEEGLDPYPHPDMNEPPPDI